MLRYLKELDQQELNALQICVLLGNTFSLDHVIDLCAIKPSKLLTLIDKLIDLSTINNNRYEKFFTRNHHPPALHNSGIRPKISI